MSKTPIAIVKKAIEEGKFDDNLSDLRMAVQKREVALGRAAPDYYIGCTVKVTNPNVSPKYMYGKTFKVIKVNPKSVKVLVPSDLHYGRFAGKRTSLPKILVSLVE